MKSFREFLDEKITHNGWISPTGEFHPSLDRETHGDAAKRLLKLRGKNHFANADKAISKGYARVFASKSDHDPSDIDGVIEFKKKRVNRDMLKTMIRIRHEAGAKGRLRKSIEVAGH